MIYPQDYTELYETMDDWIYDKADDVFLEPGQLVSWAVIDREQSRYFLKKYLDVLTEMDPMANLQIQETDEMRVIAVKQENGGTVLYGVNAISRVGALNELSKTVLVNMRVKDVRRLLERKYEWDYIDNLDTGFITGDIINVFQERNYKQCRDAFWWTHRRVDFGFFPRIILRVTPRYAINLEFGREEIGYPVNASRTLNIGLTTEVFNLYMTVPSAYPGLGKGHPLDGAYGGGLKFDSPRLGGSLSFQDLGFVSEGDITFYDPEHIIYNDYSGQLYWSFTNRIGKPEDEPGFGLPLGSLRIIMGTSLFSLVYGYQDDAGEFVTLDRTKKMSALQGLMRAEYATDMDENFINKWRFMSQLNLGLTGLGSIQFSATRSIIQWLSVSASGVYFWSGVDFLDVRLGEEETYLWEPGWYFNPSISIYF
ncbi:MAG: hypothetical protein HOG34_15535 [Bacteroidetes bacterium]|nr:hypothetical protein [Bacteroidota bacterium]